MTEGEFGIGILGPAAIIGIPLAANKANKAMKETQQQRSMVDDLVQLAQLDKMMQNKKKPSQREEGDAAFKTHNFTPLPAELSTQLAIQAVQKMLSELSQGNPQQSNKATKRPNLQPLNRPSKQSGGVNVSPPLPTLPPL